MTNTAALFANPRWTVGRFQADTSGSATVLTSMIMIVAVGIAAICIDGADYFYLRRVQQSATDLAAISAATSIPAASSLAATSSQMNGYESSSIAAVEPGTYTYNASVSPSQRFVPSGTGGNAVRVSLQSQPPFIFGNVLQMLASTVSQTPQAPVTGFWIRTRAVAQNQDSASFALGSSLATVNGGIENALLGALLGSDLSLTAMDWQSLASANIDLFSFASALNTKAQLNAGTFGSVASATVTRTQALQALASALTTSGSNSVASAALGTIIASAGVANATLPVVNLVAFGPYSDLSLTSTKPLTAGVSALDMLSAILQVANGTNEIGSDISLGISGIASASFKLTVGEQPKTTSLISIGAVGTTLHTAQTRLLLTLKLVGSGLTPLVTLPLYVEIASGTAQLSAINCASTPRTATLAVTPGLANAYIGTVSDADMTNFTASPTVSPAVLFNLLGLVQVTGSAQASISNTTPTNVSFTASDISNLVRKTTSTTDFTSSLVASLIGNLRLTVSALGIGVSVGGYGTSVTKVLTGATTPIDQALNLLLSALGVSLGNATTWVSGLACGRSTLVN